MKDARLIRGVPFFPQKDHQCGPASLAGILNYYNLSISSDEITCAIYSSGARGTLDYDLVNYARKLDFKVRQFKGDLNSLKANIDAGYPLIVLVDNGIFVYKIHHFMNIVGYDDTGLIVNSGQDHLKTIPYHEFLHSWEKTGCWTLLIKR